MQETNVYFVRHGRTPENKQEKHDQDEGLNQQGYREAAFVASYFRNINFDFVYSSQYRRANATAYVLKNSQHWKNYEVVSDPLFNEISRPEAEGRKYSDPILKKYFTWRKNIIYSPTEKNVCSQFMGRGESHRVFLERCGQIPQIFSLTQFLGKNIVVYTHSQLIVTVQTWLKYGPKPTPEQLMAPFRDRDNYPQFGSITKVTFNPNTGLWTIDESNFTEHLPK